MILALEYVLRTDVLKEMVEFPVSLFVEHQTFNDKIVITIAKRNNSYSIKHWLVSRCNNQYLPSFYEFEISNDNLFTSDKVILKNYYILKFTHNPYLYGRKQHNELPYSLTQEKEYRNYIDTFFNPAANNYKRINWLWESFAQNNKTEFEKYCSNYSYPYFGYSSVSELLENQRNRIQKECKKLWSSWQIWRKYMLDFPQVVAPELLFQKPYTDKDIKETKDKLSYLLPEAYQGSD